MLSLDQQQHPAALFKATSDSLKSGDLLLQEMPDRVVELVDELLRDKDKEAAAAAMGSPTPAQLPSHSGANIVLNIWDFAGQAAYYTTHQVRTQALASHLVIVLLLYHTPGA